ncbi:MAG TPA: molybdate ABC transporter substrate-binding protein [Isosphaeraceae bacterium]
MTRLAWILPLALLAGCGSTSGTPAPLRVAAASDLQAVMPILASRFKADTGIDVEVAFGASGRFAAQIKQGAPFDLFLSANRTFVDDLAKSGAIRPDSVRPYARGTLVLVVNKLFDPGVKGIDDLAGDKIKTVAIANPDTAPYGAAAKQLLERAKLWEKVKPKVVQGESVRQALDFVESGNAEAGFVGKAIADVEAVRSVPLPPDGYDPIIQAMGIVADSKRLIDAGQFASFLLGDVGQGILRDFGFLSAGGR